MRKQWSRLLWACLCLSLGLGLLADVIPVVEITTPLQSPGQWYKIQPDTHTGYSGYEGAFLPASLYNTVKAWKEAGFSAVVIKDYFDSIVPSGYKHYSESSTFDPEGGWYNYSVSGSPTQSAVQYDGSYPTADVGPGSGRLYVNGTGKGMVSYYHSEYSPKSGRLTLDLYRHQILESWHSYTDSSHGDVALGVEIRFTSGRSLVIHRRTGSGDYLNTTTMKYFNTLLDTNNKQPFTDVETWLDYSETRNPNFNITRAYIDTWGQADYLADKIFDFRWFSESFSSDSWIDAYFDDFNWKAKSDWEAYTRDAEFAESQFGIQVIPSLEVTVGPSKNQMVALNVNSSGINYDGTIEQFLTTSTQTLNRGGIPFLEELYLSPNGTTYLNEGQKSLVQWLNRGFRGFYVNPFISVDEYTHLWDDALRIIFDEERTERLYTLRGADLHGNYTFWASRSSYTMVYAEGTLTKQKIVEAINNGHAQAILKNYHDETANTNVTINDFSLGNWIMGDWASPSMSTQLRISISASVPVSNVTLLWNGKIMRTWTPNTNTFFTSLDVDISGVMRLWVKDQDGKCQAFSNPIFIKPRTSIAKPDFSNPTRIFHISDPHSATGYSGLPLSVVNFINSYGGDLVVLTGDIVVKPTDTDYYNFKTRWDDISIPKLIIRGSGHDSNITMWDSYFGARREYKALNDLLVVADDPYYWDENWLDSVVSINANKMLVYATHEYVANNVPQLDVLRNQTKQDWLKKQNLAMILTGHVHKFQNSLQIMGDKLVWVDNVRLSSENDNPDSQYLSIIEYKKGVFNITQYDAGNNRRLEDSIFFAPGNVAPRNDLALSGHTITQLYSLTGTSFFSDVSGRIRFVDLGGKRKVAVFGEDGLWLYNSSFVLEQKVRTDDVRAVSYGDLGTSPGNELAVYSFTTKTIYIYNSSLSLVSTISLPNLNLGVSSIAIADVSNAYAGNELVVSGLKSNLPQVLVYNTDFFIIKNITYTFVDSFHFPEVTYAQLIGTPEKRLYVAFALSGTGNLFGYNRTLDEVLSIPANYVSRLTDVRASDFDNDGQDEIGIPSTDLNSFGFGVYNSTNNFGAFLGEGSSVRFTIEQMILPNYDVNVSKRVSFDFGTFTNPNIVWDGKLIDLTTHKMTNIGYGAYLIADANNDGRNELWYVKGDGTVKVYNVAPKFGDSIVEAINIQLAWRGLPYVYDIANGTLDSIAFNDNRLNFTISTRFEALSTVKVHAGIKGEPVSVSGATLRSYDSETKIVTIDTLYASPVVQIVLHWIDQNPPVSIISLSALQGSNGWFVSQVTSTLTAVDDISGVQKTEFSFDNVTWTVYTVPFNISNEGNTTIYYKSADNNGNIETVKSKIVRIDKTRPSGSFEIADGARYTSSTSVVLTLAADDATSGIAQMRLSQDNITWTSWEQYSTSKSWTLPADDGAKQVYVQFMDNAGLVSQSYRGAITLDQKPPTANAGQDRTVTIGTEITLDGSASNDNTGITNYEWSFGDGMTGTGVTALHTYRSPGNYTVTLTVKDAAGNVASDSAILTVLSQEFPVWIVGASILTLLIIILAIFSYLMRGKRT